MPNCFWTEAPTQAVLASLLARPEPRYALEIIEEAGLGSGTVYPVLARLERMGWVTSGWEAVDEPALLVLRPGDGWPRRRCYWLTREGKAVALARPTPEDYGAVSDGGTDTAHKVPRRRAAMERLQPTGDEHCPGGWWLWAALCIGLLLWGVIIGAGYLLVDLIR